MTPKQIYFMNLTRKKKAAEEAAIEEERLATIKHLQSKVKALEAEVKSANARLNYMRKLDVMRRKAVTEYNIDYEIAYRTYIRNLSAMFDVMEQANLPVY